MPRHRNDARPPGICSEDYSNVIYMNGCEQLHSILIHMSRHSIAHQSASVEEMLMNRKLTFVAAALCGGLLAFVPISGVFAAPVASIRQTPSPHPFPSP